MLSKKALVYLLLIIVAPAIRASDVQEYYLKNGLHLLVQEDHRSPIVISEIWYKVGGSYETEGITGLSHILEHMMFRGTHKYGPGQLEKMVAENGGEQNAFTDSDFTAYYQKFSSDKLPLSFALESDRMRHLLLSAQSFTKEIQVVMEERRMRIDDNPQEMLLERLNSIAFSSSPYRHPVIGWKYDLQNITIDDVRKWYKSWYAPNNAILVVVGDVKSDQVYQLAKKYFGHLCPVRVPAMKPVKDIEPLGEKRFTIKTPAQLPGLLIAYPVPVITTQPNSPDPYVLDLIASILSDGKGARFAKNLIRKQQIAADATAYYNPIARLNNLFLLQATPVLGCTLPELEASLLDQIKQLQTSPVSSEELARAKTEVTAHKIYQRDSIAAQAYELGNLAALNLPWQVSRDYLSRINAVTPHQIQIIANKYLKSSYRTVAYLIPLSLKIKT